MIEGFDVVVVLGEGGAHLKVEFGAEAEFQNEVAQKDVRVDLFC